MSEDPKKYIVHKDTVYLKEEKGLYTSFKKCNIPVEVPATQWTGPKIPWAIWSEIVGWCQVTQELHKSEALVFLFLDTDKMEWSHWFCPQKTAGMTVKSDHDHKDWAEQRKAFPDLQFGSVHHHCDSSAFASGTDKADEIDREGLHFTVGHVGKDIHDLHYRFCVEGQCYEGKAEDVIDYSPELEAIPARFRDELHCKMVREPQAFKKEDFTAALTNISKTTYGNGYPGAAGYQNGYGTWGYVGGVYGQWVKGKFVPRGDGGIGGASDMFLPKIGAVKDIAEDVSDFYQEEDTMTADLCDVLETYSLTDDQPAADYHKAANGYHEIYETILGAFRAGKLVGTVPEKKACEEFEKDITQVILDNSNYLIRKVGKPDLREKMWAAMVIANLKEADIVITSHSHMT